MDLQRVKEIEDEITQSMTAKTETPQKTVRAILDISIWVDCPHCEHYINLLDTDDTNGHDHNEEGSILTQACGDGCWSEFEVEDVTCSKCKEAFSVKELEW